MTSPTGQMKATQKIFEGTGFKGEDLTGTGTGIKFRNRLRPLWVDCAERNAPKVCLASSLLHRDWLGTAILDRGFRSDQPQVDPELITHSPSLRSAALVH